MEEHEHSHGSNADSFDWGHGAPGLLFLFAGMGFYVHFLFYSAFPKNSEWLQRYLMPANSGFVIPLRSVLITSVLFGLISFVALMQQFHGFQNMKNNQHSIMYMGYILVLLVDMLERRGLVPDRASSLTWVMASTNCAIIFISHPPHSLMEEVLHNYIVYIQFILAFHWLYIWVNPRLIVRAFLAYFYMLLGMAFILTGFMKNYFYHYETESEQKMQVMKIHMTISVFLQVIFAVCGLCYLILHNTVRKKLAKQSSQNFETLPLVDSESVSSPAEGARNRSLSRTSVNKA